MRCAAFLVALGAALMFAAPLPVAAQQEPGSGGSDEQECADPATDVIGGVPAPQQRLVPDRAWPLSTGKSITIAVVDTGVSAQAPALADAVLPGRDALSDGPADDDCVGRGTYMAGLMAAQPSARTRFAGIAPDARIMPVRVLESGTEGDPDALAAGIAFAAEEGADVIAVSVGAVTDSRRLRDSVALAKEHDALVIAAADLDLDAESGPYPAAMPGVLPVVGVEGDDELIGAPQSDLDVLLAPGSNAVSIAPTGDGHIEASGAGIAAAFVAGVAALVRDYHPNLSAAEVSERLMATADHPPGDLPHPTHGYGIVEPYAALTTVLATESGERLVSVQPPPLALAPVPPTDERPDSIALLVALLVGASGAIAGLVAFAVHRGLKRGWRSAWDPEPVTATVEDDDDDDDDDDDVAPAQVPALLTQPSELGAAAREKDHEAAVTDAAHENDRGTTTPDAAQTGAELSQPELNGGRRTSAGEGTPRTDS